jgi:4-hydroxy-L-threonine phosphate dehydrogenase PdxA
VNAIGASRLAGPFPADGFFRGFDAENPGYDAVVAAYHDQGLIPFKLLAGHAAVNVTIGLPFLRTSVSHGTADDIAGKGIAQEDSLLAAIETAVTLT